MKTIILTGGGTAGHVFGNIALLPKLRTFFDKIIYVGSKNGIEKQILKNYHFVEYIEISTTKFRRKFSLKNLLIPFILLKSINQSKKIIKKTKPNIIFSKGGYVSIPIVLAGSKMNVPILTHESDLSLGLANKITKNKATKIFTTFKETSKNLKNGLWTGAPIREEIFKGNGQKAKKQFNVPKTLPVLLVVGGSLGANFLNNLVWDNFEFLCSKFFVFHITGKNKAKPFLNKNYAQMEYCEKIEDILAITDLAVTRGGSNALFEFLALKIPMLIVPLPKGASRGDQVENANYFFINNYAKVMQENEKENFRFKITSLLENKEKFKENMKLYQKSNAIDVIFEEIKKLIKN